MTLRAVGQSITVVCSFCSSTIDVANENLAIIAEANERGRSAAIALGTRGALNGIEWEVIGFQERQDSSGEFRWTEYLLFNPYHGYRFLMDEGGNWTLARMLTLDVPGIGGESLTFEDRFYRRFSEGTSLTSYVGGEFYWRASTQDVARSMDYVCPPYRLFAETTGREIIVSHGEFVPAEAVAKAFGLVAILPPAVVGANAPNPYVGPTERVWKFSLIAISAATLMQLGGCVMSDSAVVGASQFQFFSGDKERTVTLQRFTIPKDGNVEISTAATLDNDWLEVDVSLVNEKTDQAFDVTQGMESYSGYEDGKSWKEGDPTSTVTIQNVPAGDYKLVVSPDAGSFSTTQPVKRNVSIPGQIRIRRDVMNWSNYFVSLVLLLAFPLYLLFRERAFEYSRWSNSGSGDEKED